MRSNAGAGAALNLKFEHAVRTRAALEPRSPLPHPWSRLTRPPPPLPPPSQIMSQFHRLPGFPSSYFGLDIVTVPAPAFAFFVTCFNTSTLHLSRHLAHQSLQLHLCNRFRSQGNDSRIGFEDTLNDPFESPVQPHTHKTMEQVSRASKSFLFAFV
jgi:hypothetical protein